MEHGTIASYRFEQRPEGLVLSLSLDGQHALFIASVGVTLAAAVSNLILKTTWVRVIGLGGSACLWVATWVVWRMAKWRYILLPGFGVWEGPLWYRVRLQRGQIARVTIRRIVLEDPPGFQVEFLNPAGHRIGPGLFLETPEALEQLRELLTAALKVSLEEAL